MKLVDWQYYPKWHLSYRKDRYDYNNDSWWEYLIIVGPFQTRWWGKVWPKLERPLQYSARVKELLLEDLKTMGGTHVQLPVPNDLSSSAATGPEAARNP